MTLPGVILSFGLVGGASAAHDEGERTAEQSETASQRQTRRDVRSEAKAGRIRAGSLGEWLMSSRGGFVIEHSSLIQALFAGEIIDLPLAGPETHDAARAALLAKSSMIAWVKEPRRGT